MRLRLKPEYKELSYEYETLRSMQGCSCHINPPCSICTHEGHPANLEENDDAWITSLNHDQDLLKSILHYNPDTGLFTRIIGRNAGKVVGYKEYDGYIRISIDGVKHRAHRLAWNYMFGEIPDDKLIDHINGNVSDNRIENLRLADFRTNAFNRKIGKNNTSGYKGVCKCRNAWRAEAHIGGVHYILGIRDTPEEAHELYKDFVKEHHGDFLHESSKDYI
jgi:hypothetical protein